MKVLGFCEGARPDTGGVGLNCVPAMHQAIGLRGIKAAVAVGGASMSSAQSMLRSRIDDVLDAPGDHGQAGVVAFPAVGRWCFSPALYRAALRSAARPDIITLHSLYSFPVLAGYAVARRRHIPYALWPHGVLSSTQRAVGKHKKAAYGALVARRILDSAAVLVFTADGERKSAEAVGLNAPSIVIPHGIDAAAFEQKPARGVFRQRYLNGHTGPMILYLGRLNPQKGLDLLVAATSRVARTAPNARLVISGGGHPPDFVAEVRRWVGDAGIAAATIFTGPLDESSTLAALNDTDVFVSPSPAESFGFAIFEALASGAAVVCLNSLNYAAEMQRHDAAVTVDGDADELAASIGELLANPSRRLQLGCNGRAFAKQYSPEVCAERIETAMRAIVSRDMFPSDLKPEYPVGWGRFARTRDARAAI
jgi:glycosyltransferase involved in cell wall biosynthesis